MYVRKESIHSVKVKQFQHQSNTDVDEYWPPQRIKGAPVVAGEQVQVHHDKGGDEAEVDEVEDDVEPEQELEPVPLVSQERQAQGMLHQRLLLLSTHQLQRMIVLDDEGTFAVWLPACRVPFESNFLLFFF